MWTIRIEGRGTGFGFYVTRKSDSPANWAGEDVLGPFATMDDANDMRRTLRLLDRR